MPSSLEENEGSNIVVVVDPFTEDEEDDILMIETFGQIGMGLLTSSQFSEQIRKWGTSVVKKLKEVIFMGMAK
jgi:predicted KAP-like P-loop ATPase